MGKFTFGQTGVSYECDKVDLKVNNASPRCPRCQQIVYFNEERKAIGKSWHARCLTCCECKKTLTSVNYNECGGDVMCSTCHRRHTSSATNTHRYSSSAAVTAAASGPTDDTSQYAAAAAANAAEDDVTSPPHSVKAQPSRRLPLRRATISMQERDFCPHCGQVVYFAEQIKALKRKWHKVCFKCASCKRLLEPGKCTEHDAQLFCPPCYRKQFGPHALRTAPSSSSPPPSVATASDVSRRAGNGAVAYTDTLETEADCSNGDEQRETTQPIRGTHEWTESFVVVSDQTAAATATDL